MDGASHRLPFSLGPIASILAIQSGTYSITRTQVGRGFEHIPSTCSAIATNNTRFSCALFVDASKVREALTMNQINKIVAYNTYKSGVLVASGT